MLMPDMSVDSETKRIASSFSNYLNELEKIADELEKTAHEIAAGEADYWKGGKSKEFGENLYVLCHSLSTPMYLFLKREMDVMTKTFDFYSKLDTDLNSEVMDIKYKL